MKTIEQQVAALGWDLEESTHTLQSWRAVMGGFCTPWRGTKEWVLQDIREMARVEKLLDKADAKLAD
jgi:hypothetical protein